MPNFYKDKTFFILLCLPIPVWIYLYWTNGKANIDDGIIIFLTFVVLYPAIEELVFRGFIQSWVEGLVSRELSIFTAANIITSTLFALLHLVNHPPALAALTFFPSLIFGLAQDRYKTLAAPTILHCTYNAAYFSL